MSPRRQAAIAALVLLAFSTFTPAQEMQVPHAGEDRAKAAPSDAQLMKLLGAQTDAINALNARLKAIEKRLEALEKEKDNG